MKLTTRTIRGIDYTIHFNESSGEFYTMVNGRMEKSINLDSLVEQVAKLTAPERLNLSIHFQRVGKKNDGTSEERKPVIKHGTITGVHATNESLICRWEGQKGITQETSYSFGSIDSWLRLTDKEEAQLLEMLLARDALEVKIEDFCKKHSFNPKNEVQLASLKKQGKNKGEKSK